MGATVLRAFEVSALFPFPGLALHTALFSALQRKRELTA